MKRIIYKLLLLLFISLFSLNLKSQNDGIALTMLPNVSYENFFNPGIRVESNFILGIAISNVNFSFYNSSVKYNNIYNFENGKPIKINADKFINSLKDQDNFINSNFSLDLVRLGVRFNKLFIDIDWRLRYNGEFKYSKDFLSFFLQGNGHFLGEDNYADFSLGIDASFFTEISLGLQYDINEKLTVGIRPKLLSGVANVSVDNKDTKIYTDPDTYAMTADVNLNLKMSTMLDLKIDKLRDLANSNLIDSIDFTELLNIKENYGYGIDFGASYVFNKHFGVAAGVYDLGFIRWNNIKEKHHQKNNEVINDALFTDLEDVLELELDHETMLSNIAEIVWGSDSLTDGKDYETSLKTRIMLQAYYELCPQLRVTAIGQMYYVKEKMRPALTLAYNGSFLKLLNVSSSFTMSKYSGYSLGAGIGVTLGPMVFYVVTDNIMLAKSIDVSLVELLTSHEAANIRFGFNLSF